MKFHNQKSFMGHEISNVTNKPLLHKKGKQWIVVAVSALILAGFGGVVLTTTHADTTATQPSTAKVAPKPANNSGSASNVMKQAQNMHKTLANNAAVQKPSAPSSVASKKTAPASAASTTTSAKSSSVSASSSVSSKASFSVNSASAKSSSTSSNSNSSNNKANKPAVHMMLSATHSTNSDPINPNGTPSYTFTDGKAHWHAYKIGTFANNEPELQLDIYNGEPTGHWTGSINRNDVVKVFTRNLSDSKPNDNDFGKWQSDGFNHLPNVQTINLSGMPQNWVMPYSIGHAFSENPKLQYIDLGVPDTKSTQYFDNMFASDSQLQSITGLNYLNTSDAGTDGQGNMADMFYNCSSLTSLDLSNFDTRKIHTLSTTNFQGTGNSSGTHDIFYGDTALNKVTLGPNAEFSSDSAISPFFVKDGSNNNVATAVPLDNGQSYPGTWDLFQGNHGTWGSASWILDTNGNMKIANGKLSDATNGNEGTMASNIKPSSGSIFNPTNVTSMSFENVTAPSDSWRLFNDESGHVFNNLQTMDVSGLDTRHVTTFGAMFCGLNALTKIKGLSDWKVNSTPDTSWMFAWLPKINNLDLSKLSSSNTSNMFDGDTNLNQLTLGSNIKLTKASNLGSTEVNNSEGISKSIDNPLLQSTNNAVVEPSEDGQAHPGRWNIIKDSQYGKWGSADWHLDNYGRLIVYDGTLAQGHQNDGYGNLLAETGMNHQQAQNVKSMSFINVSTPLNSGRLFDDENRSDFNKLQEINVAGLDTSNTNSFFAMFCGLKGLQHIDNLSHLDMNNIQGNGNTWMFGADPSLQSLDLSKAKMSPKYGDGAMFIGDNSLRQLTIGPNVTFDGSTNLSNFSNDFLQNQNTKQVVNIKDINNKNNSYNGTNNIWTVVYQATINYVNNGKNLATENLISTTPNTSFNIGTSPEELPQGYQVDNPNQSITYNNTVYNVKITPKQEIDTIGYTYGDRQIGSTFTSSGNDDQALSASDTSLTVTSAPANYHIASGATSKFGYDGGTHKVAVEPNSVTNTIKFSGDGNYSSNVSGLYSASGSVSAPSGYHYINNNTGKFTYGANSAAHTFDVAPNPATENIHYIYKSGAKSFDEGLTSLSGHYNENSNVTSANDTSLKPGYKLSNTSSNPFTFANGSASDNVSVVPESANTDVQYTYGSNVIASDTTDYKGNNAQATDAGNNSTIITSSNDKDLPAGWHLASDKTTVPFDNGKHAVKIAPNTQTDTINYQYNDTTITGHQFTGNDYRATQAGNNTVDVTKTNDPNIPAGYYLANKDNQFGYDGQNHNVVIEPNKDTDIIDYNYGNKTLSNHDFSGNDSQATKAGDNSFDINSKNEPGIPAGYHLVPNAKNNNQSDYHFNYDNKTKIAPIAPNHVSDIIQYQYNSKTITTHKFGGNDYRAKSAGNNSVDVTPTNDPDIPVGYHLAKNDNKFDYNGSTNPVAVLPNSVTDTVNYQYNDKTLATHQFSGNDEHATQAGNNTFSINNDIAPGLPKGYHVAFDMTQTFYFDGSTHNVKIMPDQVSNAINYMNGSTKVSSITLTGAYTTNVPSSDIAKNVPSNYTVSKNNKPFNFDIDNKDHNVQVTPKQVTDTVNYVNGKNIINSNKATGNDYLAKDANNTSFTSNVPTGYHMSNNTKVNTFDYDGNTHNVNIYPNSITLHFNHNLDTKIISDLTGTDYSIKSSDLPVHYQLANNNSVKLNLSDGSNYSVNLVPSNVTDFINYMNGNQKVSSTKVTGAYTTSISSSNVSKNIPADYHLISSLSSMKFDNGNHDVAVKPNTVTINYMNGNSKISSATSTFDGKSKDNTVSNDFAMPKGYHLVYGNQAFKYDGSTNDVSVVPNTTTVKYVNNGKVVSHYNVAYKPNTKFNDDIQIPDGYQLAQADNQLHFGKPADVVDVSVKPITKTDTINYMYNNNKVSSAKASGYDIDSFNVKNVPAGYHMINASNSFKYDGQHHNVSVAPNVDTDTINYQANGKTLATQQFSGNDEHATQAGDNSFDVTAKNATKVPNGYELVNDNNEFGFDNGSHNVAVQAVPQPQPSVPFMPSMPASIASSASSSASAPASMAMPSSSATTKSQSASHYRYAKVVTPLQLHTSKHFTKKNGVLTVEHPTEFKIMKIVRDHKYTRYEVKYQGRNYFITANDHFTVNDYVQKHDFKSHKHMMVKVIKPMIEYKRSRFNRKYAIKVFKKGAILPVKRVFNFGKGEKTRFELTNGRFVTSNKLFVKVIK